MAEARKVSSDDRGISLANGDAADHASEAGTAAAPLSLRRRLLKTQEEVATLLLDVTVQKTMNKEGKTFGGYKGVSAAQVVALAKSALIRNGILYTTEVDRESVTINGNKTTIWVNGHFENIDDEKDFMVRGMWGSGTDNADQALSKAYTAATKQILLKTLGMTTVEDERDEDKVVEHQPEGTKAVIEKAQQDNAAALRSWANSLKAAIAKATSVEEIDDLQAGNRETLMADTTPEATRDYFIELIQKRKALLGSGHAAQ